MNREHRFIVKLRGFDHCSDFALQNAAEHEFRALGFLKDRLKLARSEFKLWGVQFMVIGCYNLHVRCLRLVLNG